MAFVGQAAGGDYVASYTRTYTSTAGNLLVLCVQHQAGTINSVTDTAGNAWTLARDTFVSDTATSEGRVAIYVCPAAKAVTSVTVTCATVSGLNVNLSEWSGMAVAGPVREAASAFAPTSSTPLAPTVTAAVGDVVVGVFGYGNSTVSIDTLASGYTALAGFNVSSTWLRAAYRAVTVAGATGPAWSLSASGGSHGEVVVALVPAGGVAAAVVAPNPASGAAPLTTTAALSLVPGTGSGGSVTYTVGWGDGSAAQTLASGATSASHTYADAGTFTISASPNQSGVGVGTSGTATVTVSWPVQARFFSGGAWRDGYFRTSLSGSGTTGPMPISTSAPTYTSGASIYTVDPNRTTL